jgi:RNA polymerase sigma-B factor
LIERFLPLAHSLASRYRRNAEPFDDLVQVANLGLVKAVDRYDPARGKPFIGYAVPTILGELRRHFRDHVWNLRLPRGLQELTMRIDSATEELTDELGEYPTVAQIAKHLDLSEEEVLDGLMAASARNIGSLDTPPPGAEGEPGTLSDLVGDLDEGFDRVEAMAASSTASVTERELAILRMRFVDEMTQREIASVYRCSQMQISRVSRRTLWKLLCAVRGEQASPVPSSSTEARPAELTAIEAPA